MALRILGFFAAVISLISHVLIIFVTIIYLMRIPYADEMPEDQKMELLTLKENMWYLYVCISLSLFGFAITGYMVVGFLTQNPQYVIPWLVYTICYNILLLIMGITLFHKNVILLREFSIFIVNIIILTIAFMNYVVIKREQTARLSVRY